MSEVRGVTSLSKVFEKKAPHKARLKKII